MTQYLVTYKLTNPRYMLETETFHDQQPSHPEVPELFIMAQKLEKAAALRFEEVFEDATRDIESPWSDELIEAAGYHVRTCGWLASLRNNRECTCLPDGSTTCEPCKVEAQIRYAYEKMIEEE